LLAWDINGYLAGKVDGLFTKKKSDRLLNRYECYKSPSVEVKEQQ
jgi:hypothetical protein